MAPVVRPAWAAHEQVRESAVLALTALVSVAGRAKDILLLIKLLLRVGHPRPTSGNQGSDEVGRWGSCTLG